MYRSIPAYRRDWDEGDRNIANSLMNTNHFEFNNLKCEYIDRKVKRKKKIWPEGYFDRVRTTPRQSYKEWEKEYKEHCKNW
jgi:hypothetical protein